ncbi:unnamed protein product, partial [Ectocarpus sp. 4 AP-2014]
MRETYVGVGSRAIVRTCIHADPAINTASVSGKRNRQIRGRVAATKGLLTYAEGALPDKAEGRTPARNFGGYGLLVSCDTVLSRKLHQSPQTAPQPRQIATRNQLYPTLECFSRQANVKCAIQEQWGWRGRK